MYMKIIFPVLYYADPFEAPDCLAAFTTEEAAKTFAKKFVDMRRVLVNGMITKIEL